MVLTFRNVDRFCRSIDLEQDTPLIDLSRLTFIDPYAVIYLGQFLRYHNRTHKFFRVEPPEDEKARKYLARIKFWERFRFTRQMIEAEGLLRFTSTTSLNDIIDLVPDPYIEEDTVEQVKNVLSRSGVNVNGEAVLETVSELVDNFARHAEIDLATLAVQYFPNSHQFAVAVGDSGCGIRQSLCQNPDHAWLADRPHAEAIVKAFEPCVSRRDQAGMGLTNILESVLRLGGSLCATSNDGFVFTRNGQLITGKQSYNLPGV